jgi:hypothetical protein
MQEASIKMVDLRHTLPNLKALLLTLSSPIPPPQRHFTNPNSRMTSRQTSHAYSIPLSDSDSAFASPVKTRVRRSRLSRGSVLGHGHDESGSDDGTETGTGTAAGTVDDTAVDTDSVDQSLSIRSS